MGWTVHYELRRDRPLDEEERARVQRYADAAGADWEVEPFRLTLAGAPRVAHGFTKLADPTSSDVARLCAVLNGLRELVAGAALVVADDLDAIAWNDGWCSYGLVGAVRGAIGADLELQPPLLDVHWAQLWLHVNEGCSDGVYLTLNASGSNQGAGRVELRRIGGALLDAAGIVLQRFDGSAWRAITAKPRAWGYGLGSAPADVWQRTVAVEIHGELRRTFAEKLVTAPVPTLSRSRSTWDPATFKPAPGRKKLATRVELSTEYHEVHGRYWLAASLDAELRMPAVDRLELQVAVVDAAGAELHQFARPAQAGGPSLAIAVGEHAPRLHDAAHVELRAEGQIDRAGHFATLRLRRGR